MTRAMLRPSMNRTKGSRNTLLFPWAFLTIPRILIYRKATLEDDRQDIRRIQERFYEDGDLLSDGVGRRRNFRWRNIDRPLNDIAESVGSDNEDLDENENEPESHTETEKRIARLEREAFLEEHRVSIRYSHMNRLVVAAQIGFISCRSEPQRAIIRKNISTLIQIR